MPALHSPWGFIRTLVWDRKAFTCLRASLLNVKIKMQVSKECFISVYLPVCLDLVSTNHSINFLHLSVLRSAHLLSRLSSNKNNVLHLKWIHLYGGLVSVAFSLWYGLLAVLLLHSADLIWFLFIYLAAMCNGAFAQMLSKRTCYLKSMRGR